MLISMNWINDFVDLSGLDLSLIHIYTLAEFVAATRFENTKNIPLRLRFSLLFGTLSRNTAIFLK